MKNKYCLLLFILFTVMLFSLFSCEEPEIPTSPINPFELLSFSLDNNNDGIADFTPTSNNDNLYYSPDGKTLTFFYDNYDFSARTVLTGNALRTINPIFSINYKNKPYLIKATDKYSEDYLINITPSGAGDLIQGQRVQYEVFTLDHRYKQIVTVSRQPLAFTRKLDTGKAIVKINNNVYPHELDIEFPTTVQGITFANEDILDYVYVIGYSDPLTTTSDMRITRTKGFANGVQGQVGLIFDTISTVYNVNIFQFNVSSDNIVEGTPIKDGDNLQSPHVKWSNAPGSAVKLVIVYYDDTSPSDYHWIRYNIDPTYKDPNIPGGGAATVTQLLSGNTTGASVGEKQGMTPQSYRKATSEIGATHTYKLTVFAVGISSARFDNIIKANSDSTGKQLFDAFVAADRNNYSIVTYNGFDYGIKARATITATYTGGFAQGTAPSAPNNLSTRNVTASGAILEWTAAPDGFYLSGGVAANVNNDVKFIVYYSRASAYTTVTDLIAAASTTTQAIAAGGTSATPTSLTLTGLTSGATYYWAVRAVNKDVEAKFTTSPTKPSAPKTFTTP